VNNSTVLITGALTGIGRATALAFAREGARVVVSGRHDNEGQKLAAELRQFGRSGVNRLYYWRYPDPLPRIKKTVNPHARKGPIYANYGV
jgi:NAD(P)-dependent dehydrogenase (short-subunit alcohol dehydrogenase family)